MSRKESKEPSRGQLEAKSPLDPVRLFPLKGLSDGGSSQ